jgi:Ca2+-binding RTX toxin-like protein
MSMRSRLILLALVGAAIAPAAAHASVSCTYEPAPNYRVAITMTAAGDAAKVSRAGNAIKVNDSACGVATVDNTAKILWYDNSGGGTAATLDLSGGEFGSAISMTDNAGPGDDTFNVWGTPQNDDIKIGSNGFSGYVTLGAGSPYVFDPDVSLTAVETADINGGEGDDVIDASAHQETGGQRFPGTLYEEGALGNDQLTAGSGTAELSGGAGNDTLSAGGQGHLIVKPGIGDDTVVGEPLAVDVLDYGDAPAGVHVDLKRTDRQDTGGAGNDQLTGFRQLTGSPHDDVLAGTEGSDALQGGLGDDALIGRLGDDKLFGGAGNNIASYAEPSPGVTTGVSMSLANQGVAQDTVTEGKDTLSGISGLTGSPFADSLIGDNAANRIDGGGGKDIINAADGPDTLLLRDGVADHAECGGGVDSVESDLQGIDALTNCENVDFGSAPSDPGGSATGGSSTGPGVIADTTLTFRFTAKKRQRLGKRGIVKVSLLCPDEACSGQVSAKLAARSAAHRAIAASAGTAKVVKLRLNARTLRRARAALRAGRKVTVRVTAVARDAAGNRRTVTRKVVLRA